MNASGKHGAITALIATTFAGALLWQASAAPAAGQEIYPSRLVRMMVPFPAGGTADVLPRILGEKLSDKWRQPVIIENRAGAGGNIGAEAVAGSPPDGYVLLASPPGPIAINDKLYKKLGFESAKFEPIVVLGTVPNVLVVKPTFPAQTVRELIAYTRANPGKVTFASQGNGSTSHLSAMLFQKLTGTGMLHVPYRGSLRILAIGSTSRVPTLPDVPTLQ
jgi:tripartite-type tricarboxylate transporter receptor subunit TctC